MAESEGFEPPIRCRIPDFESGAFDHSANSPRTADYTDKPVRFRISGARPNASRYFFAGVSAFAVAGAGAPLVAVGAAAVNTVGPICGVTVLPFAF